MQQTVHDSVLIERIISQLKHVSTLLSAAMSLFALAVLSLAAGQQGFIVFNVKLEFIWASIVAYVAFFVMLFIAASSLQTIANSIMKISSGKLLLETGVDNERRRVDLALRFMTEPLIFNPFSLLGNHPLFMNHGIWEEAHGPYVMLVATGVAPILLIEIINAFTLPGLLSLIAFSQYLDSVLRAIVGSTLYFVGIGVYLYYLYSAYWAAHLLINSTNKRLWIFLAPFAIFCIYFLVRVIMGITRVGEDGLRLILDILGY